MSTFSQGDLIDTERESMGYSPGMLTRRLCDEIDRVRVQRDALVAERDRLAQVVEASVTQLAAERDHFKAERDRLREALRVTCRCNDPGHNPATDWGAVGDVRIPHHCDCPLYPIELPDRLLAATAYADAIRVRDGLNPQKETDDGT